MPPGQTGRGLSVLRHPGRYDLNVAKNFVPTTTTSAYLASCAPVPLVFTFSVCGSMKTLDFLRWLGVDVPRWIEIYLRHAADPLEASYEQALTTATELIAYCRRSASPSESTSKASRSVGWRSKPRCDSPKRSERSSWTGKAVSSSPRRSRHGRRREEEWQARGQPEHAGVFADASRYLTRAD